MSALPTATIIKLFWESNKVSSCYFLCNGGGGGQIMSYCHWPGTSMHPVKSEFPAAIFVQVSEDGNFQINIAARQAEFFNVSNRSRLHFLEVEESLIWTTLCIL